jgi:hypothetical protein
MTPNPHREAGAQFVTHGEFLRRFAQPCFNHEYIERGCEECGWLATEEVTVFVCSNPKCGAVWECDPHGHCPACIKRSGAGFSTRPQPIRTRGESA